MTSDAPIPPSSPSSEQFIVVVGSSAGGIEALSTLLAGVGADFPAPIVIAQHLDPARPSNLAAVLERRSKLPITVVETTVELEKAHAYVVPSNRHVTIGDGRVTAEQDHEERPRPSVDLLLSTAAEVYGENVVAVILTGAGHDGASGAMEVKRQGGTVIIQNPATARFPSMPLALPPTAVDHVVDVEQIPALLDSLVRGGAFPDQEAAADGAQKIIEIVSESAGVDFSAYRKSTILRRVARRMAVMHHADLESYSAYLRQHPEEVTRLASTFLIKVTEFFRDAEAFEFIRDHVLPVIIDRARARGRVLRVWSAGCATGEEPYSIAMLIADLLGSELPEWSIKIFATDLDQASIAFARRGLYPDKALGKLPDGYRALFFEQTESGAQVSKMLRQMVIFGQQDISRGVPFPRTDLVVCRNLLIYFKPELQQSVLDLFAYSLSATQGFLFLGKAETARPSNLAFEIIDKRFKVYRCTKVPVTAAPRRATATLESFAADNRALRRNLVERAADASSIERELVHLRGFEEILLRTLPIGLAVVNRAYRLIMINAAGRRQLGVRELGHDQDFLHSVRSLPYAMLRDAIDQVFRDRSTVTLSELEVDPMGGSPARHVSLTIAYASREPDDEFAMITVLDVTEVVEARTKLEAVQTEQTRLLSDLTTANKRLNEMNKDLQDANEELQASNEEMTLAHEELQASNEELEATNEELQATNEELETHNEELQATNEELEATNEELGARTHELQDVARTLGIERARLAEMIERAPVDIMVLRGPTLNVEVCNPGFAKLLDKREWLRRPVEEVFRGAELEHLLAPIRDAYWGDKSTDSVELTVGADGARRTLLGTVVPGHDTTGRVESVIVFCREK